MKKSPLYPILFMTLLASTFTATVSTIAVATKDMVEAGERARFRAHVLYAFDIDAPEDAEELSKLWSERVTERQTDGERYWEAVSEAGETIGYGFGFRAPGFWGPIDGVVAVDSGGTRILGIGFTRHSETPGLGGRISEEWFKEQFRNKRIEPAGTGPILEFVMDAPTQAYQVEAITGATQTSTRLAGYLNGYLARLAELARAVGGETR